ncbi:MAG: acyl--CoA ligase [Myxococcota bacterium]|nr:acyl--CoA ligase [Myxococcota bacterium]
MTLDVFERALRHPRALAVVTDQRELDYAELAERCRLRAAAFFERGLLERARPLGLLVRPTLASLEALLACLAYGVPVLVVAARTPPSEQQALARRAQVSALLDPETDCVESAGSAPPLPTALEPQRALAIVPSSGSTGVPKLVELSRGAFLASAESSSENLPLAPGDRWLMCLSPAHVGGLSIVTRSLIAGSAVVLFDGGSAGLLARVAELGAALGQSRANLVSLVPALLSRLLELDPPWTPGPELRAVLLGGAATPLSLLERARARGVPVLTTYGLTEACSQVATTPHGEEPAIRANLVSAGRALAGQELRIGPGDRLCVRGPTLATRLLGQELSLTSDGFLETDDLGYLDAHGNLFIHGRASERLVSGGENVDPLQVEAALLSDPTVHGACVFGVPDPDFGELVACALVVAPDFDAARTEASLRSQLSSAARPRLVATIASLPLSPNGKLDRVRARAQATPALTSWNALSRRS